MQNDVPGSGSTTPAARPAAGVHRHDAEHELVKFFMIDPIRRCRCLQCQIKRVMLEFPVHVANQQTVGESGLASIGSELVLMMARVDDIIDRHDAASRNAKGNGGGAFMPATHRVSANMDDDIPF
jgi:hypothetical protein